MIRMVGLTIGNFLNSFLHKNSSLILNKITRNGIKKINVIDAKILEVLIHNNRSPRKIPQLSVIKCVVIAQLVWSLLSLNSSQARYPRVWWSVWYLYCDTVESICIGWSHLFYRILTHLTLPSPFSRGSFVRIPQEKCLYDLWIQTYSWFWKRSI